MESPFDNLFAGTEDLLVQEQLARLVEIEMARFKTQGRITCTGGHANRVLHRDLVKQNHQGWTTDV